MSVYSSRKSNSAKDLSGMVFGRWTVLGDNGKRSNKKIVWECRCQCGTVRGVVSSTLINGNSKSCGCLSAENAAERSLTGQGVVARTHGLSKHRIYAVYRAMKARCLDDKCEKFPYYGGRGIKVCERWLGENGFENFVADMGLPESVAYSIDRKDTNGDYCPSNCQWATLKQQSRNKRTNRKVIWNNEERLLIELAEERGIPYKVVHRRYLSYGWTLEEALSSQRRRNPLKKK